MDTYSTLIFGDFTEQEQRLYFSDESVKSSGIEFPELWNLFISSSRCMKVDFEIESQVENTDSYTESTPGSVCVEERAESEFVASEISKESSFALNEVGNAVNFTDKTPKALDSPKSYPIHNAHTQISNTEDEKNTSDSAPNNELLNHVDVSERSSADPTPEVSVEPQNTAALSSLPNVVTVGTKTMMTTSTRTVESRHEVVKSSWADLFKTKSSSKPQDPLPQMKSAELQQQTDNNIEEDNLLKKDQFRQYFLDILKKITLTNQVPSLQPRGLKNNGNWCYINATLQVLLFCPSFYHFLMKFKLRTERGTSLTPILDALVSFAGQYSEMPQQQLTGKSRDWSKQDIVMGMPFEPTNVYKLLTQVKTTLSEQGKQEDAEEFLSCILNGLHDEIVQLTTQANKPQQDMADSPVGADQVVGDWEQVGPRNRSTVTRKATISKSPVAAMFGGYLRSSLVQPGVKESASIQPFFTIQLDLRGDLTTVQQAFDNFFRVEEVEGFQCDKSKTEIEVSKKWTLDSLPVVLVLHLKRFVVNKNGCEKLTKKISYEPLLQIPPDTLSKGTKLRSKNMLTYKLFAVTYHHGKNLHGGHYTSDISHPVVGWLRADDVNVRPVPPKFVFNPLSNRDPYLLYYCRGDI